MATFQNLTFFYGETWPIEFDAVDEAGELITPDFIAIRAANTAGLQVNLISPDPTIVIDGSSVQAFVTAAAQAFPPASTDQSLIYEVRALVGGRTYTQQAGTLRVRPSLFALYPFTPPSPASALQLAAGGYLRLASGGRLLLAA